MFFLTEKVTQRGLLRLTALPQNGLISSTSRHRSPQRSRSLNPELGPGQFSPSSELVFDFAEVDSAGRGGVNAPPLR